MSGSAPFLGEINENAGAHLKKATTAELFFLLFSLLLGLASAQNPSCEARGFKETLLCSSCEEFAKYVPDEELIQDCKACCAKENDITAKKYVSARLVVCQ